MGLQYACIYCVIMNRSVACWRIFKVGTSLYMCIVSKRFKSEEVVLSMRKLLAEKLFDFFFVVLDSESDGLISVRHDLSDVSRYW